MKYIDFLNILDDCSNDIEFSFQQKHSVITPEVINYVKTYHVCYGEKIKDYKTIEDLVNDNFFNGQSLKDIYEDIDSVVVI